MRIIISDGGDFKTVSLDDEPFNVPGWVGIYSGDTEIGEVHLNELYPAVVALKERMEMQNDK